MKLTANKDNLLYGVQVVQRAVSAKNPLPVLSGILLKASNGKLTFTATDLELGIECTVPVSTEQEGGVVLPARYLGEIVRRLPDVKINLEVNIDNSTVIRYGESEFSLLGMPSEDFPVLPSVDSESVLTVKQEMFKNMVKQVGFAVSAEGSRPVFTGILMEIEGDSISLVATDTHRLAYRSAKIERNGEKEFEKTVIIPGKTLNELNRIMTGEAEELQIAFGENQVVFEMPGIRFVSRLIEGQFPNYKQVIPQGCKSKIRIETRELLEATERASLLAKEGANVVKLTVSKENLTINSNSPDIGKIEEKLPIELEGEETQVAFNSKYIIDVLKVIDAEEILLELTGSHSPGIIKPVESENYIYLILPIRIV